MTPKKQTFGTKGQTNLLLGVIFSYTELTKICGKVNMTCKNFFFLLIEKFTNQKKQNKKLGKYCFKKALAFLFNLWILSEGLT